MACSIRMASLQTSLTRFQLIEQPLEWFNNSSWLDAQWHEHSPVRLVAGADGAGDANREEAVSLQSLATLLQHSRRVPAGERRRIIEAMFALIGFGEDESQWPVLPAGGTVGIHLAQVADQLHRVKVFVAVARFRTRRVDKDQHSHTFAQKSANYREGVGMIDFLHQRFAGQIRHDQFGRLLSLAEHLAMHPVPAVR